ncbi:M20/M25/M40 family metallo-hydrolase [Helicobacter cholecystus]|nr:M20/M25/M40 family metallo-hydrolase [Helicobacter cholecystus]VEJ24872.1 aminoacyl-histidine dipeptidase [Helicobacter cholecystus]
MQEVMSHFRDLSKIPHCSFETEQMREFLVEYAKECGCEVKVDKVGNIHAYKGDPKVCLQSHYDMVCMGKAPDIEIYEQEGYLRAKDSSLGADNGIGCAIMMEAMRKFKNIECLFTIDEEVGLIGANGLEHQIKSKKLLNLDHENDSQVTIGCAGGVDIFVKIPYETKTLQGEVYEVEVYGFKGGHSGVDILNHPTSSIKTLASFIKRNQGEIISFNGGERINSIPKYAKARVIFPQPPKEEKQISFKSLGVREEKISLKSAEFLYLLNSFPQGLRTYNSELKIAQTSINLAIAKLERGEINIELFARSNDESELRAIEFESVEFFSYFTQDVRSDNFYLPWEPKKSVFSEEVLGVMKAYNPSASYYAIHAGLECGIIGAKIRDLQCCSIGPNIYNPHSTDERCEISSIEKISKVVFEIIGANQ